MSIINHQGQLFHYRGREEFQDNTRSSFKFTPTDNIWPVDQHPFRQHTRSSSSVAVEQPTSFFGPSPSEFTYMALNDQSSEATNGLSPHDFFNEHISPNLYNSRLRLGPSALRSAVDGSSPTRMSDELGWGGLLFRRGTPALQSPTFTQQSFPILTPDMNPAASVFAPSATGDAPVFAPPAPARKHVKKPTESAFASTTTRWLKDPREAVASGLDLYDVMKDEREAHIKTKAALDAEIARRVQAENEVTRLTMNNKSLIASVNMLGSIIKHNAETTTSSKVTSIDPVLDNNNAHATANKGTQNPALYSNAQPQYQPIGHATLQSNANAEKRQAGNAFIVPTPPAQDLFDFTQLEQQNLTDESDVANLSRTLRKHFLTSDESGQTHITPQDLPTKNDLAQLIDISPDTQDNSKSPRTVRQSVAETLGTFSKVIDKTKTKLYPSRPSIMEHFSTEEQETPKSGNTVPETSVRSLDTQPMLSLPAEFLVKYAHRPAPSGSSGQAKQENDKNSALTGLETTDGEKLSTTIANAAETQTSSRKTDATVVEFPYTVAIPWVTNSHNPIFDDEEDRAAARRYTHQNYHSNPTFWDHPVRYHPKITERNAYRTIMVDFIPLGTTYKDVLKHVRGGVVESIQLIPPIGRATTFMTARIVFVYETGARCMYMEDQGCGIKIRGQAVRVWQVLTPTYARSAELEKDIKEGYTRNLMIWKATDDHNARLLTKLAPQVRSGALIEDGTSHDGKRVLEFTSIKEAAKAMRELVADQEFGGLQLDFEKDACELNYDWPADA